MVNNDIWFKRKRYGYGWTPSTREGWLLTFGYMAIIVGLAINLGEDATDKEAIFKLILPMIVLTAALLRVTHSHGEKPKWQWGKFRK